MVGRKANRFQNQKRQRAQSAEPSTKRKEAEVITESNESPPQLKITDLNEDCLEHIFKQLDLIDLLNVADSRKSLKEGIDKAFTSKYAKRDVEIKMPYVWEKDKPKIDQSGKEIKIHDFVTALKFLRCFGKLFSTLNINYYPLHQNHCLEFNRCLNDYCTETLKDLTFFYAPKGAIADLKQPFANVEKLYVHRGDLGKELSDFDKWFPNLQYLKLLHIRSVTDSKCIAVCLPHLKHLEINDSNTVFQSRIFLNCFRLNPQLQTLRISYAVNFARVLKSASELPQLQELHVELYKYGFVSMREVIHFRNVKKFRLDYVWCFQPLSKLPLSFEQLNEFSLQVDGLPPSGIIQEFISMHSSVKKIDITFCSHITEDLKTELMKTWSLGDDWRASFKVGSFWHNMEFERN